MSKISKVCNPYFKRDFEQHGNDVIFLESGIWGIVWYERKRFGFSLREVKMEKFFPTKEKATEFMYKLLEKMWK